MRSMVGECSGKMRSTPCPNDTLRTVKVARSPPRCMPITVPSKIWMRSLSPSRTLTWTRTVSPERIGGRFTICACSTVSIALMTLSHKKYPGGCAPADPPTASLAGAPGAPLRSADSLATARSFHTEEGGGSLAPFGRWPLQQVRPPLFCAADTLLRAPSLDFSVIAGDQHVRHRQTAEDGRPGVMRIGEQPIRKRFVHDLRRIAYGSRHQPRDGIDQYQRWQFTAAQNVVADRNLIGGERFVHALIDPFIASADHDNARARAERRRDVVRQQPALRRHQDHRRRLSLERRFHGAKQRLGFHHHPRPAAVRHVVHRPMSIVGVVAQVAHANLDHTAFTSPAYHAFSQRRVDHRRKYRDDVDSHG